MSTERQYLQFLYNTLYHYKRALDEAIADGSLASLKEDPECMRDWSTKLFGNTAEIMKCVCDARSRRIFGLAHGFAHVRSVNTNLLGLLQEEWKMWPAKPALVGAKFTAYVPTMRAYATFVNNYDSALQLYNTLMKKSAVKALFDSVQKRPSMKNMSLEHHLIAPVQRIPRYELLFRELLKFTPDDHVDAAGTRSALAAATELSAWINEERRRWDASLKVRKIMSKYQNCPDLLAIPASPTAPIRTLVQKGKIGSGPKKRKYFLLTDHFLVVMPQGLQLEAVIDVRTAQVSDANSGSTKEGTVFTIWHVSQENGVKTIHLDCATVDQKREIMAAVAAQIAMLVPTTGNQ